MHWGILAFPMLRKQSSQVSDTHNLRKWFIWLTIPEDSVHAQLTSRQKHRGRRAWQSKDLQFLVVRQHSRRTAPEKKRPATKYRPPNHTFMTHPDIHRTCFINPLVGSQASQSDYHIGPMPICIVYSFGISSLYFSLIFVLEALVALGNFLKIQIQGEKPSIQCIHC